MKISDFERRIREALKSSGDYKFYVQARDDVCRVRVLKRRSLHELSRWQTVNTIPISKLSAEDVAITVARIRLNITEDA